LPQMGERIPMASPFSAPGDGGGGQLPATKAAGGAMNILSGQRVDPTVPAARRPVCYAEREPRRWSERPGRNRSLNIFCGGRGHRLVARADPPVMARAAWLLASPVVPGEPSRFRGAFVLSAGMPLGRPVPARVDDDLVIAAAAVVREHGWRGRGGCAVVLDGDARREGT
jgi:hypothetical protein